jgi:hypothetical protein
MKVAVVFGGMPRTFAKTAPAWRKMLGDQEVDTYVYAWDTFDEGYSCEQGRAALADTYSPRKLVLHSWDAVAAEVTAKAAQVEQLPFQRKRFSIKTGLFAQYLTIQSAFELIGNLDEYDIILRCRFDWYPTFCLDWDKLLAWTRTELCYSNFKVKGLPSAGYAINDTFLAGRPAQMRVYAALYSELLSDEILGAIRKYRCGVPEFILAWYLARWKIPSSPRPFPYALLLPRFARQLRRRFGREML